MGKVSGAAHNPVKRAWLQIYCGGALQNIPKGLLKIIQGVIRSFFTSKHHPPVTISKLSASLWLEASKPIEAAGITKVKRLNAGSLVYCERQMERKVSKALIGNVFSLSCFSGLNLVR